LQLKKRRRVTAYVSAAAMPADAITPGAFQFIEVRHHRALK
jgi:hypothetical protein